MIIANHWKTRKLYDYFSGKWRLKHSGSCMIIIRAVCVKFRLWVSDSWSYEGRLKFLMNAELLPRIIHVSAPNLFANIHSSSTGSNTPCDKNWDLDVHLIGKCPFSCYSLTNENWRKKSVIYIYIHIYVYIFFTEPNFWFYYCSLLVLF